MTLEEAYKIVQGEASEEDVCKILEYYILLRKGQKVTVLPPKASSGNQQVYLGKLNLMFLMYSHAVDYIQLMHDKPDEVKKKYG